MMSGWSVECFHDPISSDVALLRKQGKHHDAASSTVVHSAIVRGRVAISTLLSDASQYAAFPQGGRVARVALADCVMRRIADATISSNSTTTTTRTGDDEVDHHVTVEPLDKHHVISKTRRRGGGRKNNKKTNGKNSYYAPFILERSDVWCTETELNVILRVIVETTVVDAGTMDEKKTETCSHAMDRLVINAATDFLSTTAVCNKNDDVDTIVMQHVACAVLQNRLRCHLQSVLHAVALVADGSILPRKSGASVLPMASPPAIPFQAPEDSPTKQTIRIEMDLLASFLPNDGVISTSGTTVTLTGLVVPSGITLICGGGYHGKSTLLRTIAAGVYDKVPGDGREYCVTVTDAVSVRAEDGRYVNKCNVSAFISNLPTLPGCNEAVDTREFSTREASGSTSQAANVSEAIEMGATALLVDEDVSAANFMARDGRMRALVMDESITPLLYRVNGMYRTHGISSVVVVGGVGDWLDVPNTVILLSRYVASDATKKAASVSYQFSYNHVQYAGRGVVHRLPWDKGGTPAQRRLTDAFIESSGDDTSVSLMEGGHVVSVHQQTEEDDTTAFLDDDDIGCIDMSRCEQLLGKKNQLYACGLCVAWILRAAKHNPTLGMKDHVKRLEEAMNESGGLLPLFADPVGCDGACASRCLSSSLAWTHLLESVGFAYRPRRHEIFMAVTRMRGISLEALPVIDDGSAAAAEELEAERKKRELAELWNSRRKKGNAAKEAIEREFCC